MDSLRAGPPGALGRFGDELKQPHVIRREIPAAVQLVLDLFEDEDDLWHWANPSFASWVISHCKSTVGFAE